MYSTLSGSNLDACIAHALTVFKRHTGGSEKVAVYSWPQRWANSACGSRAGIAMHAFWVAPTVVVAAILDEVCVYHNGQFCGYLPVSTPGLERAMQSRRIPGEIDVAWWNSQAEEAARIIEQEAAR